MDKTNLLSQFTDAELKLYAPQLRQFNGVAGFVICTVKSDNIDLKYKEKRNLNNLSNLTTNIPVKKYFVESFPIIAFKLDKQANGNPVVIFNEDDNLRFPLSTDTCSSLLRATKKDVNEAIREFEETRGEKVKFFTDVELCTAVANELNEASIDAINKLAETLLNQSAAIDTLNKQMESDLKSYLTSIE